MQKIIFGIFAHPDDEAFGPVATLLKEVKDGTEVHLVTLTAGENGTNPDSLTNLGEVRVQEWENAAKLIGAASTTYMGYVDGTLNNLNHLEITIKISELVTEVVQDRDDIEIEFMSLDLNGYTGHIDHVVAGRSACLAFYQLREAGKPMKRIRLACLSHEEIPEVNTGFVYMEPGRLPEEIDETVDGSEFTDKIHEIMRAHHTQRNDYETVTSYKGDKIGVNYFLIKD
jgi:LmbE family N-acetylglucosaminyl deacetylase